MSGRRYVSGSLPPLQRPQEESSYFPIPHGKAVDALATMSNRDVTRNPLNNEFSVTSRGVKLVLKKYEELRGKLGINQHKLLAVGISVFAQQNTFGKIHKGMDYRVTFSLRDYAMKCGYDLTERVTSTPEEEAAERRRVKNILDEFRKKVKADLEVLGASVLTWRETVKGKDGDWLNVPIIATRGVVRGYITMTFNPDIGNYLIQLPLTQYPAALLAVDARADNAYNIGLKMAEHHSMDANQIQGRADRLSVKTLLQYTDLPTIEETRAKRKDWRERIKEPFESALDTLKRSGVLSDWKYTRAKAAPIADNEAGELLNSYEAWAGVYVQFSLKNAPDQAARIASHTQKSAKKRSSATKKEGST